MFLPFLLDVTMPLDFIIDKCWEIFAWLNFVFSINSVTESSLSLNRFKIFNLVKFANFIMIMNEKTDVFIELHVPDFQTAIDFYKILGFAVVWISDEYLV